MSAGELKCSTFATLCAIALSIIDICRIDTKYTKAAISNRAVTSGITGLRKTILLRKKRAGKHDFQNNFLRFDMHKIAMHRSKKNLWDPCSCLLSVIGS